MALREKLSDTSDGSPVATPESIIRQAPKELKKVDEAPIFQTTEKRKYPTFSAAEVTFGKVLGIGGFGVVREVTKIHCHGTVERPVSDTSRLDNKNEHHTLDSQHYNVDEARTIMANRVFRNGDARYAVKYTMKDQLTDLERARARLDLAIEVKYLKALNHPNIIRMRGYASTEDFLDVNFFFIMDRLYATLEDRLAEWKKELKGSSALTTLFKGKEAREASKKVASDLLVERITVAFDLANAFRYIHSHSIVYRDIKPENIGFDVRGDVKVFDFGLAKSMTKEDQIKGDLYKLTARTGSFPYMAPEVAKCEPYNEKADVFSFSILLWEIMSLKKPFATFRTRRDFYVNISKGGKRPPIPIRKWPALFEQMIKTAWKPDPTRRPPMSRICSTLRCELTDLTGQDGFNNRSQHLARRSLKSLHMTMFKSSTPHNMTSQHAA